MRVIELFAGIGACSSALDRLGIEHEIVDAVEIDKYAIASFNAIHGTNFGVQDICEWDKEVGEIDLIMHGSPCQDFSVAGKQAGGDIGSGTRSSLMYETIRIVGKLRPKYVIWENVKNLLSKKHRHNFDSYLDTMKNLGYTNYYQVLNAKDYRVPQNRERVFTISIRNDVNQNFQFPEKQELKIRLKDLLEDKVEDKYYLSDEKVKTFNFNNNEKGVIGRLELGNFDINNRVYDVDDISFTLRGKQPDQKILIKNATKNGMDSEYKIRKLTPKECWRLMGFTDAEFEKAAKVNSNTQLYKQAGNSIVVNALLSINWGVTDEGIQPLEVEYTVRLVDGCIFDNER